MEEDIKMGCVTSALNETTSTDENFLVIILNGFNCKTLDITCNPVAGHFWSCVLKK